MTFKTQMPRSVFAILILFLLSSPLLLAQLPAPDAKVAAYQIRKAKDAPTIDGKMSRGEWDPAEKMGPFAGPFNPEGPDLSSKKEYETEAFALWDPEHLYFVFVCREPPPFYADRTERDGMLHQQDVAEVFLDIAGDMMQYAEFQASPIGTMGDFYHVWTTKPSYSADKIDWKQNTAHSNLPDWDLDGLNVAPGLLVEDGRTVGWILEMEIPVAALLTKRNLSDKLVEGQKIRFNLLRYFYEFVDGRREHRHFNWSKTMKGCPHVSPMSMRDAVCSQ